ncbi:hypothetical protein ACQCQC_23330, partial [Ralstonia pseudosolanacearum]
MGIGLRVGVAAGVRVAAGLGRGGGRGLRLRALPGFGAVRRAAEGRADLAVHSLKDVPMELPPGF